MFNKVLVMGRLTADPELRQTPSNVATCQFTVAVDRGYKPAGEERQADFIPVVVWRQTAEFVAKYFSKGSMIIVDGVLRTRTYNDKRYPEVRHYVMEVQGDQVHFGESKKNSQSGSSASGDNYPVPPPEPPSAQHSSNGGNRSSGGGQPQIAESQPASLSIGNLNEFEEILGDGELPF